MNHVYLIPHEDGTYEARIQPSAPCESAAMLTAEGEYPVKCGYRRVDLNGSAVYESYTCANREELLAGLNCDGDALHTIVMLWDFCADSDQPHDAWVVFNAAMDKVMEILAQIDLDPADTDEYADMGSIG